MDGNALKAKIILNGLSVSKLIDMMQKKGVIISKSTFYRNLRGAGEFDKKEIQVMVEILGISKDEVLNIFFKEFVS